jgi:hypothetical protein
LSRLRQFLESANDVIDSLSLPTDDASLIQQLTTTAQNSSGPWFGKTPSGALGKFVERVIVHQERVEVLVRRRGLRDPLIDGSSSDPFPNQDNLAGDPGDLVHLNVDAKLKRCGREVRMVVPPRSLLRMPSNPIPSLLKAVARGHDWRLQIIAGKVSGRRSLSKQTGLDERYVSRILQTAFLAPDIVQAILDGRQPADFTLERLRKDVPMNWAEQRLQFGFPSRS